MAELDRSLTNIDWLISCSKDKQPIKSDPEKSHFCGNCLYCSRLRSRSKSHKTPARQTDTSPAPFSPHTPNKPSHSYIQIIATAIKTSTNQKMTLNEIYSSIMDTYPYFRNAAPGWKNSVRHNLSLNKIFKRVARPKGEPGKGAYWEIDERAMVEMKKEPKSPHKKSNVLSPTKFPVPRAPLTAPICPPFTPFCPQETPNSYLNQSFTAFYRSLLEIQRTEDPRPLPSVRHTMDSLATGPDDLSDLVTCLNPSSDSGDLFMNLKDSFSNFLRGLSVSGARTGTETNYPPQEGYSSDACSSQEFDWNAIL